MKKALVLLSGGLDSTTCLALAQSQGYDCYALSFSYGQKHAAELHAAANVAQAMSVPHEVIELDLRVFAKSALTNQAIDVPVQQDNSVIPATYVPARNTIFLSMALGLAETLDARDIFIGVSAIDYSHYPDCREEFIQAFQTMANLATKAGVEGDLFTIHTPLLHLSKAETIQLGLSLGVDYQKTISCYQANTQGEACGQCSSCTLRKRGFVAAGVVDPTRYVSE